MLGTRREALPGLCDRLVEHGWLEIGLDLGKTDADERGADQLIEEPWPESGRDVRLRRSQSDTLEMAAHDCEHLSFEIVLPFLARQECVSGKCLDQIIKIVYAEGMIEACSNRCGKLYLGRRGRRERRRAKHLRGLGQLDGHGTEQKELATVRVEGEPWLYHDR